MSAARIVFTSVGSQCRTNFRIVLRRPLLLTVLFAGAAWGHDLVALVDVIDTAVILQAAYAGTDPVPYAKVQVYAAGDPGGPVHEGKTDINGNFASAMPRAGRWRMVIDDEMGHRVEKTVQVPAPDAPGAPEGSPLSRWIRALMGVAVLGGVTGLLYGYRSRRVRG